jgi:hypothetical protein
MEFLFSSWPIFYRLFQNMNSRLIIYIDIFIMIFGHIGYAVLALACWKRVDGTSSATIVFSLPLYWLMASVAAWRAVWKLVQAPHQWEKTAHRAAFKQQPNQPDSGVS